jgi:hypothetical protein
VIGGDLAELGAQGVGLGGGGLCGGQRGLERGVIRLKLTALDRKSVV